MCFLTCFKLLLTRGRLLAFLLILLLALIFSSAAGCEFVNHRWDKFRFLCLYKESQEIRQVGQCANQALIFESDLKFGFHGLPFRL